MLRERSSRGHGGVGKVSPRLGLSSVEYRCSAVKDLYWMKPFPAWMLEKVLPGHTWSTREGIFMISQAPCGYSVNPWNTTW